MNDEKGIFKKNEQKVQENPSSWTKIKSIVIFVFNTLFITAYFNHKTYLQYIKSFKKYNSK